MDIHDAPPIVANRITISEDLADTIRENVIRLMGNWDYDPNDSDYVCEFCQRRPRTNNPSDIVHAPNCDGQRILNELTGAY